MTWLADQTTLRRLLLSEKPAQSELGCLGGDPSRWLVYRRMVRARFAKVIEEGFERLQSCIGAERFAELVDRFLAVRPPGSPYLRDVPGEFFRFLQGRDSAAGAVRTLPLFALELASFELAELEVAHVPAPATELAPLEMEWEAVLSPAVRLLELEHRVHQIGARGFLPRSPIALCVYRDPRTHDVATLELTPMAARILCGIEQTKEPLVDVVRAAARGAAVPVDAAFVGALSTLLADLVERGILLGSVPAAR